MRLQSQWRHGEGTTLKIAMRAWLLLLCTWLVPFTALAQVLDVSVLHGEAPAERVLSGQENHRFQPVATGTVLRLRTDNRPQWWRIVPRQDVPATLRPRLLLDGAVFGRHDIRLPGASELQPIAMYGANPAPSIGNRGLALELREGWRAGVPVYLNSFSFAKASFSISVETDPAFQRAQYRHIALRSAIFTMLALIALLSVAFWLSARERAHLALGASLVLACGYLAATGGEARIVPFIDSGIRAFRLALLCACLATIASMFFVRWQLDNWHPRQ